MHIEIEQIVYLHQIHARGTHEFERLLHLPHAFLLPLGPDFGGEKELVACAELGREIADHAFGLAIHWR